MKIVTRLKNNSGIMCPFLTDFWWLIFVFKKRKKRYKIPSREKTFWNCIVWNIRCLIKILLSIARCLGYQNIAIHRGRVRRVRENSIFLASTMDALWNSPCKKRATLQQGIGPIESYSRTIAIDANICIFIKNTIIMYVTIWYCTQYRYRRWWGWSIVKKKKKKFDIYNERYLFMPE